MLKMVSAITSGLDGTSLDKVPGSVAKHALIIAQPATEALLCRKSPRGLNYVLNLFGQKGLILKEGVSVAETAELHAPAFNPVISNKGSRSEFNEVAGL